MKRIEFLENMAYNSKGDVVQVVTECDDHLYYYDELRRWCYQNKSDEGKLFRYVENDDMTQDEYNNMDDMVRRLEEMDLEEIARWIIKLERK